MTRFVLLALLVCVSSACGGDEYTHVRPAGASVPSLYEDTALTSQIDANDEVERDIGRVSAFVHGERVYYWLFGEASDEPMPVYGLCRPGEDDCEPVDHPWIADAVPGDPGYSPFGRITWLEVTPAWEGERLPSFDAVREAAQAGLVTMGEPESRFAHCPIVHPDARIELDEDEVGAPTPIFVRGRQALCFDFTPSHGEGPLVGVEAKVLVRNVYVLTREGETEPLAETARGADLTGDGDRTDTNNVFGVGLSDLDYTPLWRMVTVTVPSDYRSIDTSMDELDAAYTDADDMFVTDENYDIEPLDGRIVDHELMDTLLNCPLQSEPGQL